MFNFYNKHYREGFRNKTIQYDWANIFDLFHDLKHSILQDLIASLKVPEYTAKIADSKKRDHSMQEFSFNDLKKNFKKDFTGLKPLRIAILGDSATQFLHQAIRGYGYTLGFDLHVYESDYDQISLQVCDPSSELYQFAPEYILLFQSAEKRAAAFGKYSSSEKLTYADNALNELQGYYETLVSRLPKAKILIANAVEIGEGVFGNYANKVTSSFTYQLRKFNFGLMNLAHANQNLHVNDLAALQSHFGYPHINDRKMQINADMVFSLDFLPSLAKNTCQMIAALSGVFKKVLILDLDNTTWGGIIGDDGIENIQVGSLGLGKAFSELQSWAKTLSERGIILAVCSKNTESIAKEPFERHPEMVLRLENIAVFVANWESKVDNIKYIQAVLNVGFDSMVFLDDNPFERNVIRTHIPEVTVPELPKDPAEYMPYIRTLNLFETSSFTEEDSVRTKQYQEEFKRASLQRTFTSEEDFLKSLEMTGEINGVDDFNLPRVAQLSQRSNQFNLRTCRYSEEELSKMSKSDNVNVLNFTLKDKFSDYGLISTIVVKNQPVQGALFIENWLMSCRVLKRGVESLALNRLAEIAKQKGVKKIVGEYIPTPKNGLVKDHYAKLGFSEREGYWILDIVNYQSRNHYISLPGGQN